ncbi:hypothetical protein ES332_A05G334600v1 [Gossypium tomentosum]|uniref:Uncharacterized protein n=1 Tax=Gossypium tomentosum TaxID=34277 RepID=A0A5D2QM41_GOSTO|nr:hypothetical protein ES332_A05G334600v1 [Gossypium tomentosum]
MRLTQPYPANTNNKNNSYNRGMRAFFIVIVIGYKTEGRNFERGEEKHFANKINQKKNRIFERRIKTHLRFAIWVRSGVLSPI